MPLVRSWLASLAPSGLAEERFTHRHTFPMLALPWWTEATIRGTIDVSFQRQLMESTISGYLFIRLLDDVMDGDPRARPELLPVAGLLHMMFERPYHRHFSPDSPFWSHFSAAWGESAEAAIDDASRDDLDQRAFHAVASRKLAAVKIPVTAVCVLTGREQDRPQWAELCALVGRHEQLFDDMLDWHRDAESGRNSWLLSEARRRSRGNPTRWLVSDGLAWAQHRLSRYRDEIRTSARTLGCVMIEPWLDDRRALIDELIETLAPGMASLALIDQALSRDDALEAPVRDLVAMPDESPAEFS